ncbi:MAG: DUF3298 and DUF4163 domain-containing protein [Sporomusaceae bacterium]|nr:DUF3298 and DUF4163 domain-containing protein [Sporomusaceae bacterium]
MLRKMVMVWFFLLLGALWSFSPSLSQVEAAPAVIVDQYDYKDGWFSLKYPHIDGLENQAVQAKINQQIEAKVDEFIAETQNTFDQNQEALARGLSFSATMQYQVYRNEGNLLSLTLNTYVFAGGAHGSPYSSGYTFDLTTGQKLAFGDLFCWNDAAKQELSQKVLEQVQARKLYIFTPYKGVADQPNFYLTGDNKVGIIFQKYSLGAGALGILTFEFPYSRETGQSCFTIKP